MKYPFRPIEPIDYLGDVPQFNASSKQIERFTLLSLTDSDRLEFLTNEEVHMTMQQLDVNGEFQIVPISASSNNQTYRITMDYGKFRHIDIVDTVNKVKCGIARDRCWPASESKLLQY